ncbi:MAG TPA: hypothetical protein PKC59_04425 [Burkholderiaceae bacterium]|nr:hypothetical protein [Burkholderiaceae bacterium]
MSAPAVSLLDALVRRGGEADLHQLAADIDRPDRGTGNSLTVLIRRGLVERIAPGQYRLTAAGRDAHRDGVAIKSGPRKPFSAMRQATGTLRARLWSALRAKRKGTIDALLRIAARGDERDARVNAQKYLRGLDKAAVVRLLDWREPNPSNPGAARGRWLLLNDIGPQTPVLRRDGSVWDPNSRTTLAQDVQQETGHE